MEKYIEMNYLILLLLSWIVAGWIFMVKRDFEATRNYIPTHDSLLDSLYTSIPICAILISLIINIFKVSFLSTCCYVAIIFVTQLLNINLIYRLFVNILGIVILTLLSMVAIFPLLIYMFIEQFS